MNIALATPRLSLQRFEFGTRRERLAGPVDFDCPSSGLVAVIGERATTDALVRLLSGRAGHDLRWCGGLRVDGVDWRVAPPAAQVGFEDAVASDALDFEANDASVLSVLVRSMPEAMFVELAQQGAFAQDAAPRWGRRLLRSLGLEDISIDADMPSLSASRRWAVTMAAAYASDAPLIALGPRPTDDAAGAAYVEALIRRVAETQVVLLPVEPGEWREGLADRALRLEPTEEDSRFELACSEDAPRFRWLIPGQIGAALHGGPSLEEELALLARRGVRTIVVSDDVDPQERSAIASAGFELRVFSAATERAMDGYGAAALGEELVRRVERGEVVAVRGDGARAARWMALYLVAVGHQRDEALALLRSTLDRPTGGDEAAIEAYVDALVATRHSRALASFSLREGALDAHTMEALPFGVVRLDLRGTVIAYNTYEARLARREASDVLGKNFFRDVAPCTSVKRFFGRFLDGVSRRSLDTTLRFRFPFEHGARNVDVAMHLDARSESVWVLVRD